MSIKQNAKSIYLEEGKRENLNVVRTFDLQYSPLGWLVLHRLKHDRDLKILVTSKGNTTGTGKTTLAIYLAREFRRWANDLFNRNGEWTAKEYAFMNESEYTKKYLNSENGDILLTDELESMVDNRRSMGHENVRFTQLWMEMRFKNVITIGTAPGLHTLDKRVPQNADIWINVIAPGRAYVYFLTTDDFEGHPIYKRFKLNNFKQSLIWAPPESDEDYQYLNELKETHAERFLNWFEDSDNGGKDDTKEVLETAIYQIIELNEKFDMGLTQEQIANEILDGKRSQQYVSKVKREMAKD